MHNDRWCRGPDVGDGNGAALLYEGATHFHGGSPAAVVGPYIRTEIADWLPERSGR